MSKKQVRLVVFAVLAVALLGAAALLLAPREAAHDPLILREGKAGDVKAVRIDNANGTISVVAQDEGFFIEGLPAPLLDFNTFTNLLTHCAAVKLAQQVDPSPRDRAAYGLDKPSATVAIDYTDGSSLRLSLGNQERVSGGYYCAVNDSGAVYLLAGDQCKEFLLSEKEFLSKSVTPALQLSSPLSAVKDVSFSGSRLKEPITLKAVNSANPELSRLALSFGAPTHLVLGPTVYEFDQTYGTDILNSLLGIMANDIALYNQSAQQIADFGFANPDVVVEFGLVNGLNEPAEQYKLAVLKKGDLFYMTCNDNGIVYEVPRPAFYDVQADKLPVRWFLSPMIMDLTAVELTVSGQAYRFELTGEKNDKTVTCNGKALDIERFRKLYQLLTSAANNGTKLENTQPAAEPLMTLKFTYLDAQKAPDVLNVYPGDTLTDFVQINGVMQYAMLDTYLTRVQNAMNILFTDQAIETDW